MSDDYAGPGVPSFGPRWCFCPITKGRPEWGHKYETETCPLDPVTIQAAAERDYPDHAPSTALANFKAGRQVWDSNGDLQ